MSDGSLPQPETILVVDDNAPNRILAKAMLTSSGYSVRLAENGEQAIADFAASPPSLVLLNVLMPGIDGFETLKRLRALPGGETTPVVIVTALADLASVQRAIEAGADDFVAKPINRTELLVRVSSLIGRRKRVVVRTTATDAVVPVDAPEETSRVAHRRDHVASLLVHDLKHPLTTIYFNAGLLGRDPTLSAKGAEKVRRILRSSETLETMIMSVLDVTCSADGSLPVRLSEFEIPLLLADVVAAMEPQAELSNQKIELVTSGERRRIKADRDLLRRMLENLIDNSTKYGPPDSTIRLEVATLQGSTQFRVRDEGPGVPADHRQKLFERGFQLNAVDPKVRRGGRGLGLTSVRVGAEAHGGRVWIEDHAEGGSCFCIEIPLAI